MEKKKFEKNNKKNFLNKNQKINKKKNLLILGNLYIKSSFKNTIISLTKNTGELLRQWSTKSLKKTSLKKNTPYNIQLMMYKVNYFIKLKKIKKLNIFLNGRGLRKLVIKNLLKKRIKFGYVYDKTVYPFNGCQKKIKKTLVFG